MKSYFFPVFIENRTNPSEKLVINPNWGSLIHGVLMEKLPEQTVLELHKPQLNGFSQYILGYSDCQFLRKNRHLKELPYLNWFDAETPPDGVWSLSILEDSLIQIFDDILLKNKSVRWDLKYKNCSLIIGSDKFPNIIEESSFTELSSKAFHQTKPIRRYRIDFLTTTSFKQSGDYVLFPSEHLVLQNLIMRWDTFSKQIELGDEEVYNQLLTNTKITSYNLRSRRFSLNGSNITGFNGNVILNIRGPEALARLINIVMNMANFSGVGIKSALGMGGINVQPLIQDAIKDK